MNEGLRAIWTAVTSAMASWHQWKLFIERAIAVSHDSLHVIVGVLLFLALCLVLRRPVSSWRPWLWLLAAILWNETVDLWVERWPDAAHQFGECAKDVLMTMLLPTVLLASARWRPDLFRAGVGRRRKRR